jgi:hypothetical protein
MYCAPHLKKNNSHSCYSADELKHMAHKINTYNKKQNNNNKHIKEHQSLKNLWYDIRKQMSEKCVSESCWIKQAPFKDDVKYKQILRENFRPESPRIWLKEPKTWLMTPDIFNVMVQYEKVFPDFMFMGPVPSDCPSGIMCELTNLDIKKNLKNGIKRIGIVYNLDTHDEDGSHWVATFISVPDKSVEFFDSYGEPPQQNIKIFLDSMVTNGQKHGYDMKYKCHKNRHQFGGSECGIFSLYYILERLHGVSFSSLQKKKITDKQMNALRKVLYRPPD